MNFAGKLSPDDAARAARIRTQQAGAGQQGAGQQGAAAGPAGTPSLEVAGSQVSFEEWSYLLDKESELGRSLTQEEIEGLLRERRGLGKSVGELPNIIFLNGIGYDPAKENDRRALGQETHALEEQARSQSYYAEQYRNEAERWRKQAEIEREDADKWYRMADEQEAIAKAEGPYGRAAQTASDWRDEARKRGRAAYEAEQKAEEAEEKARIAESAAKAAQHQLDAVGAALTGTAQADTTPTPESKGVTIPLERDLGVDLFFGSGLGTLLPPAGYQPADGGGVPNFGPLVTTDPALDPQLDTGGALLDGASLPAAGVPGLQPPGQDLVALHNNFHANQQAALALFQANQAADDAAALAAFQAGQNTAHNNQHTLQDNADAIFHNVFGGNPGFGAQHGQFHALEGQVHGDFHAQQAADLNALQANQAATDAANLTAFQGQQDTDHTNFHTAQGI